MVEGNYDGIFFDHAVLQADTQHLTTIHQNVLYFYFDVLI